METTKPAQVESQTKFVLPSVIFFIVIATIISFACNLDKFVYPSVIPLVVKDLGISFTQAGFLMGVVGIMGIFVAIPSGIMISKAGIRFSGVIGLLLTAFGCLIIIFAGSYFLIVVGRALAGAAERLVQVVGLTIIGMYVPRERNALAQGLLASMIPISIAMSSSTMGYLGASYGWRSVFVVSVIIQLITAIVFYFIFKNIKKPDQQQPPAQTQAEGQQDSVKARSIWNNPIIWQITVIWAAFQGGTYIMSTWFPTFLKESLQVDVGVASLLASIGWWVAVIGSILIGWLSDITQKRKIWVVSSSVALAIIGFLLASSSSVGFVLVLIALAGLAGSILPAPLLALVPEVVDKRNLPEAFGILSTGLCLALFVIPTFAGWLRDISGTFTSTLYLLAILSAICAIVGFTLKTR